MKPLKSIQLRAFVWMMMTLVMGLLSCNDDDKTVEEVLPPTITKVCVWDENTQTWNIPQSGQNVRIGDRLRIEGTHMAKAIAVYINGGQVTDFMAEENAIELIIPDIPIDKDVKEVNLNLVRVVNKSGAAICTAEDFQYFGKEITFTGLSLSENGGRTWTEVESIPIGSRIRIEGDGLKTIKSLLINGIVIDIKNAIVSDNALVLDIPDNIPFGKAVEDVANVNKMVIETAYDGPKSFDCIVVGKQAEITKIVDSNGNEITEAGRNTVVKIEGKYFSTLQKLSFNGQNIQPTAVESNCITFTVPVDTEEFTVGEGNIEVVNAYDESGVKRAFKILGFIPNVTSVSYTMPKPGNVIRLTGVNLLSETEVYFPSSNGDIKGIVQNVASDRTSIDVLVPNGVGDKEGYIRLVSEGNEVTIKGIVMFYKKGVFLREFTDDELKLGSVSGTLTQNKFNLYNPSSRPVNDTQPINPDYFICLKNASIPVTTTSGAHGAYLRFNTKAQIEKLLQANSDITTNTLVKDIVLQIDVYMPKPWASGMLAWRINKDAGSLNSALILNLAPWTVSQPFNFNGEWHTFTYKFTDLAFTDDKQTLTLGVWLGKYAMNSSSAYTSLLTFVNGNFISAPANPQWNCVPITDFEMNLANMRLVPLSLKLN